MNMDISGKIRKAKKLEKEIKETEKEKRILEEELFKTQMYDFINEIVDKIGDGYALATGNKAHIKYYVDNFNTEYLTSPSGKVLESTLLKRGKKIDDHIFVYIKIDKKFLKHMLEQDAIDEGEIPLYLRLIYDNLTDSVKVDTVVNRIVDKKGIRAMLYREFGGIESYIDDFNRREALKSVRNVMLGTLIGDKKRGGN